MDNRSLLLKQLTTHRLTAWFLLAAAVLLAIPLAGCGQTDTFSQWDTNQDGFIAADEVSDAKKQKFQRWVQAGDKNKDGQLDPQEFRTANAGLLRQLVIVLIVLGVTVLPAMAGNRLARALRMQDYGWKIGLVLCSLCMASAVTWFGWPPKFGIDLQGGVILVYEIDQKKTKQLLAIEQTGDKKTGDKQESSSLLSEGPDVNDLVRAIRRRINPGGVREIVIRPYGNRQVEVIIPEVEAAEIELIKQKISTSGFLEFLIVANSTDHQYVISRADTKDPEIKIVTDQDNHVVARWVEVAREEEGPAGSGPSDYRGIQPIDTLRNAKTGQIIKFSPQIRRELSEDSRKMIAVLAALGAEEVEVLMKVNPVPDQNVKGSHLRSASSGVDNYGGPCVDFRMTRFGASRMGILTGGNLPDKQTGIFRRLGIVIDGQLISAPTIQGRIDSQGRITGRFTSEEVTFLSEILRAGRLPAVLREEPISEVRTSAILGADTVRKGKFAIVVSLISVLVFMLFYYRFSGVIACLALLTNLILILAMMILVKAAFTLPGLAGLVLTVGMSVDANVLIFERIREELHRGAALRMAIRNGFGRATTTIVDANLTTLITAIVLYVIGTDQIKGFAVTLILGILVSMFTAIFCSRITFDIFERKRWITKLRMMHILGETRFDFMGKRHLAAAFSILLIVVGLAGVVMRGKQIFDIDFNGGTSVQILLTEWMRTDDVRAMVQELPDASVNGLQLPEEGGAAPESQGDKFNTFKIDTSRTGEEEGKAVQDGVALAQDDLKRIFGKKLRRHMMKFGPLVAVAETAEPEAPLKESPPEKTGEKKLDSSPPVLPESIEKSPPTSPKPKEGDESRLGRPRYSFVAFAEEEKKEEKKKAEQDPDPEATKPPGEESTEAPAGEVPRQRYGTELTFDHKINATTLEAMFREAAKQRGLRSTGLQLSYEGRATDSSAAFKHWNVAFALDMQQSGQLLKDVQDKLADMPVWLSSSKIGGKVAGDTQSMALAALLTSLLGIVGYIWVRFQRVVFGLAAVVALVHDVLITLGALALSLWLSKALGFLLIDEFKISLPVVAAFLTIIGYSLNDTIVVFDRIREVRGKSPDLNQDMINISINQTLSRTVLTSITTLLVVLILYTIGGQGIHAFAFALVVGVLVGTYSSIFVASPCLLWLMGTGKRT